LHKHNPYARREIERWLEKGNKICAMTRKPFDKGDLVFVKEYKGDLFFTIQGIMNDQGLSQDVPEGVEAYRNGIVAETRSSCK
jgi:hypothetical protein